MPHYFVAPDSTLTAEIIDNDLRLDTSEDVIARAYSHIPSGMCRIAGGPAHKWVHCGKLQQEHIPSSSMREFVNILTV